MKAITKALAALALGAALLASGGAASAQQQMYASKSCDNGDTARMFIGDAVVVERRNGSRGAPMVSQGFPLLNYRAAQSAYDGICH